jgi:16S rRNA (guanine1207-N2)-methyltransferase
MRAFTIGMSFVDRCLQHLLPRLGASGRRLWIADEQVDASAVASAPAGICAVTNRCDVQALLRTRGIDCALNDFDLGAFGDEPFDTIAFRVAKEKALVHHVINAALQRLRPGGWLWLAGEKSDGIRTYIDKTAAGAADKSVDYAGALLQLERDGPRLLGGIRRGAALGEPLDERNYTQWQQLQLARDLTAWSKPGIFGWQKLDAGSTFLIEQLDTVFPAPPQTVLDLGCGYGYLTLMAARRWPQAHFTATDNNVIATEACRRNLREAAVSGEVYCSDAGGDIDARFDAVLCNPPFHSGFDVDGGLTDRFLAATAQLLAPGGRALFVVNQFIGLEARAQKRFRHVETVARNRSFKLVALAQPVATVR